MNGLAAEAKRPRRIVLIRHGESAYNKARAGNPYFLTEESVEPVKGIPDHNIALTSDGRRQATATGTALAKLFPHFDVLYHSNYRRTIETAELILAAYSPAERTTIRVRGDDRLRERNVGYGFHMTKTEIDAYFPFYQDYCQTTGYFRTIPPGGESQAAVCDRVFMSIGRWFDNYAGRSVAVVAHEGTIRAVRYNLEKWSADKYEAALAQHGHNCGIWVYEFSTETKRLELTIENHCYYPIHV